MAVGVSLTQSAQFALELLKVIVIDSEARLGAVENARQTLSEFMTKRPSPLQKSEVWTKLNLQHRVQ